MGGKAGFLDIQLVAELLQLPGGGQALPVEVCTPAGEGIGQRGKGFRYKPGIFVAGKEIDIGQGGIISHFVHDLRLSAAVPQEHIGKLAKGKIIGVFRRTDGGIILRIVYIAGHEISVGGGCGAPGIQRFCKAVKLRIKGKAPFHLISAAPGCNAGVVAEFADHALPFGQEGSLVFGVQQFLGDICQRKLRLDEDTELICRRKKALKGEMAVLPGKIEAVFPGAG